MSSRIRSIMLKLVGGGLLSPAGWVFRAIVVLGIFTVFHIMGWRDDMRVISGTSMPHGVGRDTVQVHAMIYGVAYFAAVIICPIAILAAGLYALLLRWLTPRSMDQPVEARAQHQNVPSR